MIKGIKDKQLLISPLFMKEFKRKNTQATTDQFFNENNTKERIKAKKINEFNRNDKKSYNIHQEDLIMCIQCEGKIKSEANKTNAYFTLLDEMFLTVYSECVANAVSRIVAFREIQHKSMLSVFHLF